MVEVWPALPAVDEPRSDLVKSRRKAIECGSCRVVVIPWAQLPKIPGWMRATPGAKAAQWNKTPAAEAMPSYLANSNPPGGRQ
jgi:hypothetical protein